MGPPPAAAQPSYPVVCRGGPTIRLAPEATASGSRVLVRFTRGVRGAVGGVDPGRCAWRDRGVSAAKPAAPCFLRSDHVAFEMNGAREVVSLRVRAMAGTKAVIFWEGGERPDGAAFRLATAHSTGTCAPATIPRGGAW